MSDSGSNKIHISRSLNPRLNLAIENYLYLNLQPGSRLLFIYRNSEAVVMGRFQNPWIECPVELLARDGIPLLRRMSGGGTVFHDQGNTNISFMAAGSLYNQDENYALLEEILHGFGVPAEKNERNDLMLEGKKISGSAFKKTSAKSMHHCSLLLNANLENLRKYLNAPEPDISAKGTRSVRSSVRNCAGPEKNIGHEDFSSALIEKYRIRYGSGAGREIEIETIDDVRALSHAEIRQLYEEQQTWEWIFGKTPPFTQHLEWCRGVCRVAAELSVRHCRIDELKILEAEPEELRESVAAAASGFSGIPYRREDIETEAKRYQTEGMENSCALEFFKWAAAQIYFS